jgi:quercetin dioxygenase-like cupin family protein
MEPDHPGMHMTATVDYVMVLEGAVDLELDDGKIVQLGRGTALIQNGTRHAWRPAADGPCLVTVVMSGAEER